jgi:hypothetical protein
MNEEQKRAWKDARDDYYYSEAKKKLDKGSGIWDVIVALTLLGLSGYGAFYLLAQVFK